MVRYWLGPVVLNQQMEFDSIAPCFTLLCSDFLCFFRRSFTRVTRGPENGAYYHPLFQRDNLRLCMQMSCINSKAPQAIQSMNPVALGLAANPFSQMGMTMAGPNNPAQMAFFHDRQNQLYQQQLSHQGIMAVTAMHNQAGQQQVGPLQQEGNSLQGGTSEKPSSSEPSGTSTDVSNCTEAGMNPTTMSVFQMQQHHYYTMLMAQQQQQMMAMAAGNPAMMAQQQQQMAQLQQPTQLPQDVAVAGGTTDDEAKGSKGEAERKGREED
jgi:hypothetical protein